MDVPVWFGKTEFYVVVATMWCFMICWVSVNLIRVGGIKVDIRSRIVSLQSWWIKRKGNIDPFDKYQRLDKINKKSE